jgi:hypothetical protein
VNEPEVFVLADRTLAGVIAQIPDDAWDQPIPEGFATSGSDHTPTMREIVDYHAYDDAWVPDMLAGLTMDEAGRDRFDGNLLGDDPAASFSLIVDAACAAAEACTELDRIVHCSFGPFPARAYFWQINSFRALRAHDIAKVIGADTRLPPALVQGIWDEVSPPPRSGAQWACIPPRCLCPTTRRSRTACSA